MDNPIYFEELSEACARRLWRAGSEDEAWPLPDRSLRGFLRHVDGMLAAEVLGYGRIRAVVRPPGRSRTDQRGPDEDEETLLGWVTWSLVAAEWVPESGTVVEGGTYLLPAWRDKGWNPVVKRALATVAFTHLLADWLIFLVPVRNERARRALEKLSWPFREAEECARFQRLLARRHFETGEPFCVYALHRTSWPNIVGQNPETRVPGS